MVAFNRIKPDETGEPCEHEAWMVAVGDLEMGIQFAGPFIDLESAQMFSEEMSEAFNADVTIYQMACPACLLYGTPEEESDDAISGE